MVEDKTIERLEKAKQEQERVIEWLLFGEFAMDVSIPEIEVIEVEIEEIEVKEIEIEVTVVS